VTVQPDDPRLLALTEPGSHGSWSAYVGRLWARRQYITHVPLSELRSQQMNTVLGNLWHLFNPILLITVYALVFGVMLKTDRGVGANFVAFLAVGIFVFNFTQKAAVTGSQSIIANRELLRSISFPRALLPITAVITELLAFLPSLFVMLLTALVFGEPPRWSWFLLPLLVLGQTVFSAGAALVAARAASSFDDVKNVLPFVFRLLFYGSGVLFSARAYVDEDSAVWWVFVLNPMYDLIELYRWLIFGTGAGLEELISLGVWTAVLFLGGLTWFRQAEASYGS